MLLASCGDTHAAGGAVAERDGLGIVTTTTAIIEAIQGCLNSVPNSCRRMCRTCAAKLLLRASTASRHTRHSDGRLRAPHQQIGEGMWGVGGAVQLTKLCGLTRMRISDLSDRGKGGVSYYCDPHPDASVCPPSLGSLLLHS